MAGFVYGLRTMPLSTAYAITFVAPLLVTAMAGPLLKEKVGAARWTAIGIGLVGVLVILRPTGEGMLTGGGLAILVAAICYALGAITVRMLAQRDSTQAMVFWFVVLLSLGAWLLALPAWKPLKPAHAWIIAGVGVSGSLAQVALTEAFRRGEASLIAPLEYTALAVGRAAGRGVVVGAAGRRHLDRRGHHRGQRALPVEARKGPRGSRASLTRIAA